MNAKQEFLDHIEHINRVKCAIIGGEYMDEDGPRAILPVNYTGAELDKFLEDIDFTYDDGYGGQQVYGTIWYNDGTWAERGEYDGSEWWEDRVSPEIPKELVK